MHREADFLIIRDQKPMILVEARLSDAPPQQLPHGFQGAILRNPGLSIHLGGGFLATGSSGLFVIDLFKFLNLFV